MKSEHGGIALNLTLVVLIAAIASLGYILLKKQTQEKIITNSEYTGEFNMPEKQKITMETFSDGLGEANAITRWAADETGAGIVKSETFNTDINGDKVPDRITKIRHESGTAHFWDEYKIELNQDGRYRDITPKGLRTTVGAECALQQIQFQYKPNFKIIKISRPWRDSWTGPSMATRTIYTLENNKLVPDAGENLGTVCDVSELF